MWPQSDLWVMYNAASWACSVQTTLRRSRVQVFVEERLTAQVLARLLNSLPSLSQHIKAAEFVGTSTMSSKVRPSARIEDLRSPEVAMTGVDFHPPTPARCDADAGAICLAGPLPQP